MAKQYKNDIFKVITELDKRNYNFFKNYDEDQYKELQPYTLLRWLSATQSYNDAESEYYILATNNLVNSYIFHLSEHKNLLLNLLCSCGLKKWVKHSWIPMKTTKVDKEEKIVKDFYKLSDEEWDIKKETISKDDVEEILRFLGKSESKR